MTTPRHDTGFNIDVIPEVLSGPVGSLEILAEGFHQPGRKGVAIVCHPHSLHGGTMHNKVVHYVARTLGELGFATIRFNFRGVGKSEGNFDHGNGETEDTLAIVQWVKQQFPEAPLWLAGFSFGAYVALRVSQTENLGQLITVAPAVNRFDPSTLQSPNCPWLLLQGENDDIVPLSAVTQWLDTLTTRPHAIFLKEVDHFFHGRLPLLRQTLLDVLAPAAAQLATR